MNNSEYVRIEHLKKYFPTSKGVVHAVDDVTMSIAQGKTMGVVGESGCGKSTLGRVLIHLLEPTDGKMIVDGEDVTFLNKQGLRKFRFNSQIIFQDPYSSLNPRLTVEDAITRPLKELNSIRKLPDISKEVTRLMDMAGVEQRLRRAYPHELDGGRRQRVVIARALAFNPKFIVCDEPVSALDVSIQAQILNLLKDLQEECGLTYMFITHDMSVVRHISDDISVMYLGQLVETSPAKELFHKHYHPYTKALLSAIPSANIHKKMNRIILNGEITSPIDPPAGCRFAARCNYACERCHQPQTLEEVTPGHFVACCRVREINEDL